MSQPSLPKAVNAALYAYHDGRKAEAGSLCTDILISEPNNPYALYLLGLLVYENGDKARAANLFRQAVTHGSDRLVNGFTNLAVALLDLKKEAEALQAAECSAALFPDTDDGYCLAGIARIRCSAYSEAVNPLERATCINPKNALAWYWLGKTQQVLGQFMAAQHSFAMHAALSPSNQTAQVELALAHLMAGCSGKADAVFAGLLGHPPGSVAFDAALGRLLFNHSERLDNARFQFPHFRLEVAIAAWRRVLAVEPGKAEACVNLGFALRVQHREEEAFDLGRRALVSAPDMPEAHVLMGRLLYRRGRLAACLPFFMRAKALADTTALAAHDQEIAVDDLKALQEVRVLAQHLLPSTPSPAPDSSPIIFIHFGYNNYLIYTLLSARLHNPDKRIILLGDHSNEFFKEFGIDHVSMAEFRTGDLLDQFERSFTFVHSIETIWDKTWSKFIFERWYIIHRYATLMGLQRYWTFDSDTLIVDSLAAIERQLGEFGNTEQCGGSCLNGFIADVSVVQNYLEYTIRLFQDPAAIARLGGAGTGGGAFNEMTVYRAFRDSENLKTFWLGGVIDDSTFIDFLWAEQDTKWEIGANGHKVLRFGKDGYCYINNTKLSRPIRVKSVNLSFASLKTYRQIFAFNLQRLERERISAVRHAR